MRSILALAAVLWLSSVTVSASAGDWLLGVTPSFSADVKEPEMEFYRAGELVPPHVAAASGIVMRFLADAVAIHDGDHWLVAPLHANECEAGMTLTANGQFSLVCLIAGRRFSEEHVEVDGRDNTFTTEPADHRERKNAQP